VGRNSWLGSAPRPTNFGPSLWRRSKLRKLASIADALPAAASLLGLAAHIPRNRIEILHSTDRPRNAIACLRLAVLTGAKALIHVHVNYGASSPRFRFASIYFPDVNS
jgi:hypothetical protein